MVPIGKYRGGLAKWLVTKKIKSATFSSCGVLFPCFPGMLDLLIFLAPYVAHFPRASFSLVHTYADQLTQSPRFKFYKVCAWAAAAVRGGVDVTSRFCTCFDVVEPIESCSTVGLSPNHR